MIHNEILEHLYDSDLDCLSENEFDDYEDEVADKTWTLPSTNRHVEQVSSSNEEKIFFNQNIPVSQPSTSTRPIQTQKTISVQKKNSRPAMQWCKINERRNLEPGSIKWLGHADLGEPLDTPAQYFKKYFNQHCFKDFQRKLTNTAIEQLDKIYELHLKKYKRFLACP